MFISIVDFKVVSDDRAAALAAPDIRAMPDNLAFRAFLDPEETEAVCVLHE